MNYTVENSNRIINFNVPDEVDRVEFELNLVTNNWEIIFVYYNISLREPEGQHIKHKTMFTIEDDRFFKIIKDNTTIYFKNNGEME